MKKLLLIMLGAMAVLPASARDFSYEYGSHTLTYTVLSEVEKTVSTAKGNRAGSTLKIPATVYDENNETYTVTEIGSQSFADCKRLISATIPNTVTRIGDGAFSYCAKLTTVWLPGSLTSLGEGIFANSPSLKYIYYNTDNPTSFNKNVITSSDYIYKSLTLYMPDAATVDKCRQTSPWMYFNNIEVYDFSQSAVDEIKPDESMENVPMFDLCGRKVTNPQIGQVYIRAGKKFIQR